MEQPCLWNVVEIGTCKYTVIALSFTYTLSLWYLSHVHCPFAIFYPYTVIAISFTCKLSLWYFLQIHCHCGTFCTYTVIAVSFTRELSLRYLLKIHFHCGFFYKHSVIFYKFTFKLKSPWTRPKIKLEILKKFSFSQFWSTITVWLKNIWHWPKKWDSLLSIRLLYEVPLYT